ncbi:MAG: carboxypeptidase regulatory-like domain-containing protein [candidate division NC10 bacterium]|nr:carboxypeptidase regulatory-like domain-containing protein [candidate division NC10 bacterium]
MFGTRAMAVAGILAFLLAGCATVKINEVRVVTGRVTDLSGQPVATTPVVIVGRSLDLVTTRLEYEERGRQEAKGTTDAEGRYRIEFVPAALGNNFYLFFYDKAGFDQVKYRRPEPLDITPLLERDRALTVNQVLQYNVAWPEVERQMAFYGPGSERAQILRRHGLPEKRETSGTGDAAAEVWWYYADGVSYWFTGDKLTRTHQFQPIPGATPTK